ncbi:hypothetical protein AB5I41_29745 [Sphingomonas sp. MMS24-JH45]
MTATTLPASAPAAPRTACSHLRRDRRGLRLRPAVAAYRLRQRLAVQPRGRDRRLCSAGLVVLLSAA